MEGILFSEADSKAFEKVYENCLKTSRSLGFRQIFPTPNYTDDDITNFLEVLVKRNKLHKLFYFRRMNFIARVIPQDPIEIEDPELRKTFMTMLTNLFVGTDMSLIKFDTRDKEGFVTYFTVNTDFRTGLAEGGSTTTGMFLKVDLLKLFEFMEPI
jgi:hypothetical protein